LSGITDRVSGEALMENGKQILFARGINSEPDPGTMSSKVAVLKGFNSSN
jgi:hypothetical protein